MIDAYLFRNPEDTLDRKRAADERIKKRLEKLAEIKRQKASRRHKQQVRDAKNGRRKVSKTF